MKHLQFWWNIYIFYKVLRAIRLVLHLYVFWIPSLSPNIGEIFVKVSSNGTIVILWERYGTSEQAKNKRIFQFRCATKNVCLVQIFRLRSFSRQRQKGGRQKGGQGEARGGKERQGQTRAHKGKSKQTFGPDLGLFLYWNIALQSHIGNSMVAKRWKNDHTLLLHAQLNFLAVVKEGQQQTETLLCEMHQHFLTKQGSNPAGRKARPSNKDALAGNQGSNSNPNPSPKLRMWFNFNSILKIRIWCNHPSNS